MKLPLLVRMSADPKLEKLDTIQDKATHLTGISFTTLSIIPSITGVKLLQHVPSMQYTAVTFLGHQENLPNL